MPVAHVVLTLNLGCVRLGLEFMFAVRAYEHCWILLLLSLFKFVASVLRL